MKIEVVQISKSSRQTRGKNIDQISTPQTTTVLQTKPGKRDYTVVGRGDKNNFRPITFFDLFQLFSCLKWKKNTTIIKLHSGRW